jgi:hypothetical protein
MNYIFQKLFGNTKYDIFRLHMKHRINNSCTWGSKHALVIRGLKLGQIRNLGG